VHHRYEQFANRRIFVSPFSSPSSHRFPSPEASFLPLSAHLLNFMNMATTTKTPNSIAKSLEPFVCGGSAATFASIIIHPMDLAKVMNLDLARNLS
jgi:hypothetical protein